ncbi:hypothetical protein JOB18_036721 [Solea senegalensis]|uniref:Uncharacterized protein n=1 Tax=Solea senegalensis TaxID=28829 RepID=A0AAV6S829_SOLSE|nr:hypothetical protein JOB18_036721 [Solea senegalensis]
MTALLLAHKQILGNVGSVIEGANDSCDRWDSPHCGAVKHFDNIHIEYMVHSFCVLDELVDTQTVVSVISDALKSSYPSFTVSTDQVETSEVIIIIIDCLRTEVETDDEQSGTHLTPPSSARSAAAHEFLMYNVDTVDFSENPKPDSIFLRGWSVLRLIGPDAER